MEYCSNEFDLFCADNGIIYQTNSGYTPQQYGIAERKNRTLLDMINCMINHASAFLNLWGEALSTATHILNFSHHKKAIRTVTSFNYMDS